MKKLLLVFVACFCLISCQTIHDGKDGTIKAAKATKGNIFTPTVIKKECLLKCEQKYKSCRSQCHNSCRQCQRVANKQACKRYQAYYKRMWGQGTYRPRDWLSFRDPLQCRKVSCSCPADLNVCVQQCGGQIRKQLRATPYCQ